MKRFFIHMVLLGSIFGTSIASAAEQTVTLSVENMNCASCPFIVKQSLSRVQGVLEVQVSYDDKTALVVFDAEQTTVSKMTKATLNAGYPSKQVQQ